MTTTSETDLLKSVSRATGRAHTAVRLSSASLAECYVCSSRTTLTDTAASNLHAHESHAHCIVMLFRNREIS
jgi:hypothetical protein